MQAYRIRRGAGINGLQRLGRQLPAPGPAEVRLRIRAVALNYRDLMVARGAMGARDKAIVPGSDGAGEVVAVGSEVTSLRVGDRVIAAFFPRWNDGPPTPESTAVGLGGAIDGVLAEDVLIAADALVPIPDHLSFAEAATIPCAGVVAWNALLADGQLAAGDSVLLLGTGGVSIWALQLAKAAGLRTLITSSDDLKLERARRLGADATINYRTIADWDREVLRLTQERGADRVLEVGGPRTLRRSIAATRIGGTIAIVGSVGGTLGEFDPYDLIDGAKVLRGVLVGSWQMTADLVQFLADHRLRPLVDRVFPFAQAREAYAYLEAGRHFGKVVVDVGD
jgi:NADPH:quinone reductase-like Zn-dependent oxidoreductase